MNAIISLILASTTLGQVKSKTPKIPTSAFVESRKSKPNEIRYTGAVVLETLAHGSDAEKLAVVAALVEILEADVELCRLNSDFQSGALPLDAKTDLQLPGLELEVDPLLPLLVNCLEAKDPRLREITVRAFRILKLPVLLPVLPALLRLLADARPEVKIQLIDMLSFLGPYYPDDRIPLGLVGRWRDNNLEVRAHARTALRDLIERADHDGGNRVPDIPTLSTSIRQFLSDKDRQTRAAALCWLSAIGKGARSAREDVVPFLREIDEETRYLAACTILRMDGRQHNERTDEARRIFSDLIARFHPDFFRGHGPYPELPNHEQAVLALGPLAVDPVLRGLQEEKRRIGFLDEMNLQTLGRLGPEARDAIPGLKALLNDPDAHVRITAATAIAAIDPADPDLIRQMIATIEDTHSTERDHAAWVLGSCGSFARVAIPVLEETLAKSPPLPSPWRVTVANSLARIDSGNQRAIPVLIETLKKVDADGRWSTIETLAMQGDAARDAIPLLLQLLEARRDFEPLFCHEALFRIDPKRLDSLTTLIDSLNSGDEQVKLYAMVSLGRIGGPALEALPRLEKLSLNRSRLIRDAAAEAIEKIHPIVDRAR